jgi:hypothetical protein
MLDGGVQVSASLRVLLVGEAFALLASHSA